MPLPSIDRGTGKLLLLVSDFEVPGVMVLRWLGEHRQFVVRDYGISHGDTGRVNFDDNLGRLSDLRGRNALNLVESWLALSRSNEGPHGRR